MGRFVAVPAQACYGFEVGLKVHRLGGAGELCDLSVQDAFAEDRFPAGSGVPAGTPTI